MTTLRFAVVTLLLAACGPNVVGTTPPPVTETPTDMTTTVDPRASYPAGPYGVTINQRIENFGFGGYTNTNSSVLTKGLVKKTTDFQSLRSLKSTAGTPYRYALMALSAVWCAPCNEEAESLGQGGHDYAKLAEWEAKGGVFLTVLTEGQTPGRVANNLEVASWLDSHKVANTMLVDETQSLARAGVDPRAVPSNLVIDLETMKIVAGWSGIDSTYAKWEGFLSR